MLRIVLMVIASVSMLATPFAASPQASTAQKASVAAERSQWITLGTAGGPIIRKRSQPANALIVRGQIYLFDTGAGTIGQMARAGLSMRNVAAIFISHHHIDHDADLGPLVTNRWMFNMYSPLPIIGPAGTVAMMAGLSSAARAVELAPIGTSGPTGKPAIASTIAAHDLGATMDVPTEVYRDENIRVLAITNTHYHYPAGSAEARFSRSYSYRVETTDRTYLYTGDTGPSTNVERLGRGADILISEVIDVPRMTEGLKRATDLPPGMLPAMIAHMEEDHMKPTEVGKMARAMGVKEVVLTHVVPGADGEGNTTSYTAGVLNEFHGPVRLANDLDHF